MPPHINVALNCRDSDKYEYLFIILTTHSTNTEVHSSLVLFDKRYCYWRVRVLNLVTAAVSVYLSGAKITPRDDLYKLIAE